MYVRGDVMQASTQPSGEVASSQSPECTLVPSPLPPTPPPSPPSLPPGFTSEITFDVPLVNSDLQSAISVVSLIPIASFQFDIVDTGGSTVGLACK